MTVNKEIRNELCAALGKVIKIRAGLVDDNDDVNALLAIEEAMKVIIRKYSQLDAAHHVQSHELL